MNVKIIALSEDQLLELLGRAQNENLSDSDFIQRLIDSSENMAIEALKEDRKKAIKAAPKSKKTTKKKAYEAPTVSGKASKAHEVYEAPKATPQQIECERHENESMLQKLIDHIHVLKSSSKSIKRKVACIITDQDGNIVSTGVNDSVLINAERLEGFDHNQPGRFKTFEHVLHAEEIALSMLPMDDTQEYNMFLTSPPCLHCSAQILNAARVRGAKINVYVVDPVSKTDMIKFAAPEWYQDGITPEQIMLDETINHNLVSIGFLEDAED